MFEIRTDYINRELSWLLFNYRVLEEAEKTANPILERFRFLAITSSNLDEFMEVRVAGVKQQVKSKYKEVGNCGYTPSELYSTLNREIKEFNEKQYACLHNSLIPELKKHGIRLLGIDELSHKQLKFLHEYFDSVVFPLLTPIAVDDDRKFPRLAGKKLNIAVRLKNKDSKETCYAVVPVPSNLKRFVDLPRGKTEAGRTRDFIMLEEIMISHIEALFDGYSVKACDPFRITRNSDVEIDDEAPDLLVEVQKSIKKRIEGEPVRLEILKKCDSDIKDFLIDKLDIKKNEIYKSAGPLDLTVFSKFANLDGCDALRYEKLVPEYPAADFVGEDDIFAAIKERDRMIHCPYESFMSIVDFLNQAADDPDVLAIKQTLYRVSGNSPVIAALIRAAQNGKQVTVLVELKARFDEANNVEWAKKLEKAGCHVIYGLPGLKTHCKILTVIRREDDQLRSYMHLGTGNYNESTAKLYTDIGLFTCREEYGSDSVTLFNMLTSYAGSPVYKEFKVAPRDLRKFFEHMIKTETENALKGKPAGISAKINSLVDPKIIELLYKASQSGVKINLLVRGICCLIPGKKGLSENITVHSIVGQLLEHSRIFKFENGGEPKLYMGSADWMQRNLDKRVELVFPIADKRLFERADNILSAMFSDTENTRIMQSDGSYISVKEADESKKLNCQREFIKLASLSKREAERTREDREKSKRSNKNS